MACYSIVKKPRGFVTENEITLKRRIEGDDLEKCRSSIEELLQMVLDGEKFPSNLMMPVINRYQMNRFSNSGVLDKRIKKLLYILWECLPKRGPDGKFQDKLVMVCGAFDRDLKHPNQYVCGSVLRTLFKTREPEVIRELIYSIEKCLEWSHSYQRKNAVIAIAQIYKNFPDLNPTAPKLISEYLLKENDDECKKAALQALLEIDPEEAKFYLHSCNISDIHCMNASIQLLFVELIQRIYKRGSEESESYVKILTSLIKSSSSPSVRYQAAAGLIRFSRDPEAIKISADCFIDICSKDSDNNVKLIAFDSLMNLRRIEGADRILRTSLMDIISILQSAKDIELNEKILRLSWDLITPLNVGGVVVALRQELKKIQDTNVLSSQQETVDYRRLLVDTVHKIAGRFPHAIVEFEMLDTLFDLLKCSTVGEKTTSRLVMLFKKFLLNNPSHQAAVIKKIQECFSLAKDNSSARRGLLQLLGDFSETKEQIEQSYQIIKESLEDLPKNKFDTASTLCFAFLKMASRYQKVEANSHRLIASFMLSLSNILNLGQSNLADSDGNPIYINKDHTENLVLGLSVLQNLLEGNEVAGLMKKIVTEDLRSQLGIIVSNQEQERLSSTTKQSSKEQRFDDRIPISLFSSPDSAYESDSEENDEPQSVPDMFTEIPLTGTGDPIYAYCEFDVNQYDIGLKIHLENRTKSTFENVTIELAQRGDAASNFIDPPEPKVLGPRASACITSSVKVVSTESRRLFGCITYDNVSSDDREQVLMLNDLNINLTDNIQPAWINFDDFRDIWKDCEWENKVTVKTKITNLKDYLAHLVNATKMRCVTSDRGLSGECNFLSANLYARSAFGEEALVNVSIEKTTPSSPVKGNVKIRSRSQGMALSLGEKITAAQTAAS